MGGGGVKREKGGCPYDHAGVQAFFFFSQDDHSCIACFGFCTQSLIKRFELTNSYN